MADEIVNLFMEVGLTEKKAKETLKNKNLSASFKNAIDFASSLGKVDDKLGKLLYQIAGKVKDVNHLKVLSEYISKRDLKSDTQINCAISYMKSSPTLPVDEAAFATACGVGVVVTPEEIEKEIENIINKYKKELLEQRYQFNFGKLLGDARQVLKFADGYKVKGETDMQVLDLLGPKTASDEEKAKGKKKTKKPAEKKVVKKAGDAGPDATLEEQLRGSALKFHKCGENYTTDGYVMTDTTMDHMKKHLDYTGGQVRTRFPPEPNGILHIGHAKAIIFNFGYAKANDGVCFLRYDDTNPEKEEERFFTGIQENVKWLGFEPYKITYASDNFGKLYELAVDMIKRDLAYVCHQKQSEIQGINPPPSPYRNRPIEESLALFEDMKNGKIDEGGATLRMKHVMEDGKTDPVAYRIKFVPHHRTGDDWCIYPTYDYTHCLCDSIENISHSLCTKEFQARRSSYYWLCNSLDQYCPVQWEYGRLNLHYTVVSKRKLGKLIEKGIVNDWDDPRLYTLTALKRRGFPAEAIRNFCAQVGVTGNQVVTEPAMLESCVRDVLNQKAKRRMVVQEPLKVVITNFPGEATTLDVADFPVDPSGPTHKVTMSKTVYIDRCDFAMEPTKGYKRFSPDQSVGLRHSGYCLNFERVELVDGELSTVYARCEPTDTVSKRPKGFIHWVSAEHSEECEIRMYSRLFKHKAPEDKNVVPGGFVTDCDTNSLKVLSNARMERSLVGSKTFETFQFERVGYFCVDKDSTDAKMVFNLTIPLKEDAGKQN